MTTTTTLKEDSAGKLKEEEEWMKYVGVKKSGSMFMAIIRYPKNLGGHRVWVGTYNSPKLAALAYDQAAFQIYGTQAVLNFPLSSDNNNNNI
ncbi:putative transcription factor AP2-EREBP family [Helianthus annuus]|nr:putative transcription factor AP2-EREBP family [Helianthus annuus]